ncbi:MAG: MOSC N-terminal beta barrel domain-containing protein [Burkholderiaceae bacterium]
MSVVISGLYTYPVKSCAGIPHTDSPITQAGLAFDRRWVMVDHRGIFMTQRTCARVALIRPRIAPDRLTLDAPGMPTITILSTANGSTPAQIPVRIFDTDTIGSDEGDDVAQWLSQFLHVRCRLLRMHPQAARIASPEYVDRWIDKNNAWATNFPARHVFGFADAFPFLVINQASLNELNQQLEGKGQAAVPMNRFRPNIVLQGLPAYDEDYLSGMRINGMTFAFVKRCARCPIPNINQETAVSADEPNLTLMANRSFTDGVLFGVNAVVADARDATLNVGDPVEIEYDL